MFVLVSGPLSLLSLYLAYLCYRQARYRHTLALALVALFMLLVSIGVVGAGYLTGVAIRAEIATTNPAGDAVLSFHHPVSGVER
ncbi:MAG: hypothetical protein RQ723_00380 [Desulfuromonadales bacterium]|nr:hypothetical protein [Desulfuromonadales bacterium]